MGSMLLYPQTALPRPLSLRACDKYCQKERRLMPTTLNEPLAGAPANDRTLATASLTAILRYASYCWLACMFYTTLNPNNHMPFLRSSATGPPEPTVRADRNNFLSQLAGEGHKLPPLCSLVEDHKVSIGFAMMDGAWQFADPRSINSPAVGVHGLQQ